MYNPYLLLLAAVICAVLVAPGMFITLRHPVEQVREEELSDALSSAISTGSTHEGIAVLQRPNFHPTVAHLAQAVNVGNDTLVEYMLRSGELDINAHYAVSPNNPTILGIAAQANRSSTAFLLLSQPGIRVNERDDSGVTPLGLAIRASRSNNFSRYDTALVLMADPRTDFTAVSLVPALNAEDFANKARANINLIYALKEKKDFRETHALPDAMTSRLTRNSITDAPALVPKELDSLVGVWSYSKSSDYHIKIYKGLDGVVFASLINWGGDGQEREPQPVTIKDNIAWIPYPKGYWIKLSKLDSRPSFNMLKYSFFGTETGEYVERMH